MDDVVNSYALREDWIERIGWCIEQREIIGSMAKFLNG